MIHNRSSGFTLIELLTTLGVMSLLFGLLMPAVQKARAAAARASCLSNMRQLAIALHQYHDTKGSLPPSVDNTVGIRFRYLSWNARILPWLEMDTLWREVERAYDISGEINDAAHDANVARVLPIFICPADSRRTFNSWRPFAANSYLGVSGLHWGLRDGMLYNRSSVKFNEVTDGLNNTLLFGERPLGTPFYPHGWYGGRGISATGYGVTHLGVNETANDNSLSYYCEVPQHFKPATIDSPCGYMHFWSFHRGGGNFAMADGSVRFFPYAADAILPALAMRNGSETVSPDNW